MGKYTGPNKLSATIQDVTYCADGTVRTKSSLTSEQWKNSPTMRNTRRAAQAFGGALTSAGCLFRNLWPSMRRLARRHAHNHIAVALRKAIAHKDVDRYTFEDAIPALHRLDISASRELSGKVLIRTLGHPLQPKGIHIIGLKEAAVALKHHWTQHQASLDKPRHTPIPARLQFRIHLAAVDFPETYFLEGRDEWISEDTNGDHIPVGNWMDVEEVPDQGLAFRIASPNPHCAQIIFLGIEWRLEHGLKKPPKSYDLQPYSLLKVAALYRPESDQHLPVPSYLQHAGSRRYQPSQARTHARRPPLPAALKFRLSLPMQAASYLGKQIPSWAGYAPELLTSTHRHRKPKRPADTPPAT
jgi:hypothetical protein